MPERKTAKEILEILEKNRGKFEQKYGQPVKFEKIDMSDMVLIRRQDGGTYVAYWNLMVNPPKLVIENTEGKAKKQVQG